MILNPIVFPIQNQYYFEILNIVQYRKINKLKKYSKKIRIQHNLPYCESHHIIPKSWYKLQQTKIDNSDNNIVNLTAKEHLQIHILLYKYFLEIKNIQMYSRMLFALNRMIQPLSITYKNLELNNEEKTRLLNEYEQFKSHFVNIKLGKRTPNNKLLKWPYEYVIQLNNDYLNSNFNWQYIKKKYNLKICRKTLYGIFKFYKLKYSKRNRLHKYDKNVFLQISIDYTKYGFDYVKIKYNLTFSQGNLFRIFKALSIPYKKCWNSYIKYSYDLVVQMRDEYNINGYEGVKLKFNYMASKSKLLTLFTRNKLHYNNERLGKNKKIQINSFQ